MKSIILALIFFCSFQAYAIDLQGVAALALSGESYDTPSSTTTTNSKFGFGLGALLTLPLAPFFDLQPGVLYLPRKFALNTPTGGFTLETQYSYNAFQFPILVRFSPIESFSVGLGPYISVATGDVNQESSLNGSTSSSTQTFAQAQFNGTDYGAVLSAALKAPIVPTLSFVIDGRMVYGFQNLSTSSQTTLHTRDYQLLAGLAAGL